MQNVLLQNPEITMVPQNTIKNPCVLCRMRGLCDNDECGMKLYELDAAKPPIRKMTPQTLKILNL